MRSDLRRRHIPAVGIRGAIGPRRAVRRTAPTLDGGRAPHAATTVAALVAACLAVLSAAEAGIAPALTCQSVKLRASARATRGVLDCHARAILGRTSVDPAGVAAARQMLSLAFAHAEAAGGCATAGDAAAVARDVDALVAAALAASGAGASGGCAVARLGATGKYVQRLLAAERRYKMGRNLRRLVAARAAAATAFAAALERGACAGSATPGGLGPAVEAFVPAVLEGLFCGDAVRDLAETCDAGDDALCPGACRADCRCPPRPFASTCLARGGPRVTVAPTATELDYDAAAADTTVDARAATFLASPASLYPVRLGGRSGVCIVGGTVDGRYERTLGWDAMHTMNNAGIIIENDHSTVEGARIDNVTDGIRPNGGPFTIRGAWLSYVRDDCVENDHARGGLIEDSLLDGCYVGVSERPSPAIIDNGADGRRDLLTIRGSLIRLAPMPGPRGGAASDLGHGGFFKWHDLSTQLSLHDNVFMAERVGQNGPGSMDVPPLASCADNVMVWLGGGAYPAPLPPCFTVTTDRKVWDDAVAAWKRRWAAAGG